MIESTGMIKLETVQTCNGKVCHSLRLGRGLVPLSAVLPLKTAIVKIWSKQLCVFPFFTEAISLTSLLHGYKRVFFLICFIYTRLRRKIVEQISNKTSILLSHILKILRSFA